MKPVEHTRFGQTRAGEHVRAFTLEAEDGLRVRLMTLGASVLSLEAPDAGGEREHVVLGYDTLEEYERGQRYLASVVGRYANRIAGARYALDGVEHRLAANEGLHQLHGGPNGLDRVVFEAEAIGHEGTPGVCLRHTSRHGSNGHPGELAIEVEYRLTDPRTLRVEYRATTDRPTHVSLTWHGHFDLSGRGSALEHELWLAADTYVPVDSERIPTGEIRPVEGTSMDFRSQRRLGRGPTAADAGWDHCFVLPSGRTPTLAARLQAPASGRTLELSTDAAGLQLYTGHALRPQRGRAGRPLGPHGGICLETQHLPNAPNVPDFPTSRLDPGDTYRHVSEYRFS